MKLGDFVQPSTLLAIGMLCASVVMLTKNSMAAAVTHTAPPEQAVVTPAVTTLPVVVVMGKRLSPVEKARYRQMLKASAATLV